ncbi:Rdx family protein [bacterium]|nr:Rdx family protein [bacterium]
MNIRIKYCVPCGYRKHAERLASLFRSRLAADVVLETGSFGVFKIWRDDILVFDKRDTRGWLGKLGFGLLPNDETLVKLLANKTSPSVRPSP